MEERFIRVPRTARYHVLGDQPSAKRVWFVLHGYGQLARFFLNKFEGLEKDLLIIAPEGLSRFYLDNAHERVGSTWMTREDRKNEIRDQIEYLDLLADRVLEGSGPGAVTGVLGFSQGVATACRWALTGRTKMERMVLWGGSMPPELEQDAMHRRWKNMIVDLVHGNKDVLVPISVAERNATRLDSAAVPHQVIVFEGGHDLEPVTLGRCLTV